ncbi:MAG: class B sortase [Eubacteriales bacterium]|nr:class B sortase [Clostridiales bacterium]MDD7594020.1 class B sortase [Clostridiales bacterium]MDY4887882.1 class B sortase [Eubacteriales bacterium]MDY5859673.1 class B sortase [Eubacteriales bacterium]
MSEDKNKTVSRKYGKKDILRITAIAVCLVVFAVSVGGIISILNGYGRADKLYGDISSGFENAGQGAADGFFINPMLSISPGVPLANYSGQINNPGTNHNGEASGNNGTNAGSAEFQRKLGYLNELREQNYDTYGFIQIDGTKISYPVVQAADNDYYVKRGFNKKYLSSGTIFVDYRNSRTISENRNLIIYGHNMLNGSMFHDLARYDKNIHDDAEDFFASHDEIRITTFDGIYTFKIFSFYQTTDTDPYLITNFFSDEAFLGYCNTASERSMYNTGITVSADDVILTLSTCVNGKPTERYACHAKLIDIQK